VDDKPGLIYHIMGRDDWDDYWFDRRYEPPSLKEEGFIHASTLDQVVDTAERLFAGREDLVLLCIDPAWVQAKIRFEDLTGRGVAYPHIYGHISLNAVLSAYDLPLGADGRFHLPRALAAP
jgi:uncharacterized protein (DUF952 family)